MVPIQHYLGLGTQVTILGAGKKAQRERKLRQVMKAKHQLDEMSIQSATTLVILTKTPFSVFQNVNPPGSLVQTAVHQPWCKNPERPGGQSVALLHSRPEVTATRFFCRLANANSSARREISYMSHVSKHYHFMTVMSVSVLISTSEVGR